MSPTAFFRTAASLYFSILASPNRLPHSVKSKPGSTALTRTLCPCVKARLCMRWRPRQGVRKEPCQFTTVIPAAFDTEYAMELPVGARPCPLSVRRTCVQAETMHTAIEEVMRNTPPSEFELKVGRAARMRNRFAFVLMAQHWAKSASKRFMVEWHTLSHSSSDIAFRSPNSQIFVQP